MAHDEKAPFSAASMRRSTSGRKPPPGESKNSYVIDGVTYTRKTALEKVQSLNPKLKTETILSRLRKGVRSLEALTAAPQVKRPSRPLFLTPKSTRRK
jgi:hypothetical protein